MWLCRTSIQHKFLSPQELPFYYRELPSLDTCQSDDGGSARWCFVVARSGACAICLCFRHWVSIHYDVSWLRLFCHSQGTVLAKRRPGSVCTTTITGVRRGPTRAASSVARGKRTSVCTVMPPGSTPQGLSNWWRKAAGWMTSTAMTGRITVRGHSLLRICIYISCTWLATRLTTDWHWGQQKRFPQYLHIVQCIFLCPSLTLHC